MSLFIMCDILLETLDSSSWQITAKVLANRPMVRELVFRSFEGEGVYVCNVFK